MPERLLKSVPAQVLSYPGPEPRVMGEPAFRIRQRVEHGLRVAPGLARMLSVAASAGLSWLLWSGCGRAPESAKPSHEPPGSGGSARAFFEDVTRPARLEFVHQLVDGKLDNIMKSDGAGGAVLDYDNDGFMDVYLVNSGPVPILTSAPPGTPRLPNGLFRNRGDGTFEDTTRRAGVEGWGFGTTAAAADYDNDGFTDLLVVNFDGLILYHNEGDGTFAEVTEKAGLTSQGAGISATFLDANNDGYLDLFVANYLRFDPAVKSPPGTQAPYPGPLSYAPEFNVFYRNRGDGTFEDVSLQSGIRIPGHRAMSVAALDYDQDGHQDLYVSNDGTPNLLLANNGQGHFADVGVRAGVGFNQFGAAEGSMGATVGDCNGDGLPDLFVTRFGNASLYLNLGGGLFDDRIQASGILTVSSPYTGWGGNFLDYDNDGDLDLFIANGDPHFMRGMPPLLLANDGQAHFTDASAQGGPLFKRPVNARGSGAWDFDNDGRMDLFITSLGDRAELWRNVGQTGNHWLTLQLEGTRSNRDSFGAQVRLTAGGCTRSAEARCPTTYVFQQDPRLHFGLAEHRAADRIEIRWPSGQTLVLTNVAADRILRVTEPGERRWPTRP